MDDAAITELRGRVTALEEIIIGFIAAQADQPTMGRKEFLGGWLKAIKQSSQLAQRPIGPEADAIWDQTVESLEHLFRRASGEQRRF